MPESTVAADTAVKEEAVQGQQADDAQVKADPEPQKEDQGKGTEGTPDKALQKMQQQLGTALREIDALKEKKAAEGQLSEADKAKLAKAQERLDKIRQFTNRKDRDEFPSEVDPVAEHVLDLTDKVSEVDKLKAQLEESNKRLQLLESDRNWSRAREKYSGLDVDAIWEKAQQDALETLGEDASEKQVGRLASKWFEERCEAAKKRQNGDGKPAKKEADAAQYKVGDAPRTAPTLTEDEEVRAEARQLGLMLKSRFGKTD